MLNLPPPLRRVLSDDAYEELKALLIDGEIPAGARVNIDQLAERLQISPTPIREALARLESEGLVTKEPMRGYAVSPMLDATMFVHLYEVRLLLEPRAAGLAALHRSDEDLAAMAATIAGMRASATGPRYREFRGFAAQDGEFHRRVASASTNPFLVSTLERLHAHQQLSRLWIATDGVPDARDALVEHEHMLEAIKDRDATRARDLMQAHLRRSRTVLMTLLDPEPDDEAGAR